MDEFFEAITMMQTGKLSKLPIVLIGKEYHEDLWKYIQNMINEKTISPEDAALFLFTDSIKETIDHINKYAIEGYGLKKKKKQYPLSILGEYR